MIITDEVFHDLHKLAYRFSYFAWSGIIFCLIGLLAAGFFFFISTDVSQDISFISQIAAISVIPGVIGAFILRRKRKMIRNVESCEYIRRNLFWDSLLVFVFAIPVTVGLFLCAAIPALVALVFMWNIISKTTSIYMETRDMSEEVHFRPRSRIRVLRRLIYPPINHDVWWHRLVTVVGWVLTCALFYVFFLVIPLYFGVIQRVIYFVVYGKQKESWVKEQV